MTKGDLNTKIRGLSAIVDATARQTAYAEVMKTLHDEAVFLPLTAKRNTAVTSNRLSGFKFATTEYGTANVVAGLKPA
eukprot:1094830-Prymnesium_polylepis.2